MPTKREREYYRMGFRDGERYSRGEPEERRGAMQRYQGPYVEGTIIGDVFKEPKRKRKLSAWNKYVKNKRNHITYRDGKLNLKKMAVAFRRKKRR